MRVAGADNNGSEAAATLESLATDSGHRVGNGDRGESAATREGRVADAGHRVGDGDGGQAATVSEGVVVDDGHRVGDGDGGNTKYILVKPICVCEPIKCGKAN